MTSRDLKTGETVLQNAAYACVPTSGVAICQRCWCTPDDAKAAAFTHCSRCGCSYCSESCRQQHWGCHRAECRGLAQFPQAKTLPTARLLAHIVHTLHQNNINLYEAPDASQRKDQFRKLCQQQPPSAETQASAFGALLEAPHKPAATNSHDMPPKQACSSPPSSSGAAAASMDMHESLDSTGVREEPTDVHTGPTQGGQGGFEAMCTAAVALLSQRKTKNLPDWSEHQLLSATTAALGRIQRNGHSIVDAAGQEQGKGVFLLGSMVNHSCRPSAMAVYTAENAGAEAAVWTQHLAATRPLQHGDNVTIGYVDPLLGVLYNRHVLKSDYGFECECVECGLDLYAMEGTGELQPGTRPCRVWRERGVPCQVPSCSGMCVPCKSSNGWAALRAFEDGCLSSCDLLWACTACGNELSAAELNKQNSSSVYFAKLCASPALPSNLSATRTTSEVTLEAAASGDQHAVTTAALHTLGVLGVCPEGSPVPAQQLLHCGRLCLEQSRVPPGLALLRCAVAGAGDRSAARQQPVRLVQQAVGALLELISQAGCQQATLYASRYATFAVLNCNMQVSPLGACGLHEHMQLQEIVKTWII